MGSSQPHSVEEQTTDQPSCRLVLHRHQNPSELYRIFKLFDHDPYHYLK
jgi:hypothetical protein